VETHTHRPENSGRLYSNEDYEDNPAASPAAMRARSEAYTRRAKVLRDADDVVRDIDRALDGTPAPEPKPHNHEREHTEAEPAITKLPARRRLADVAILITNIEETVGAPETEAA
jgi:hypothetical protein